MRKIFAFFIMAFFVCDAHAADLPVLLADADVKTYTEIFDLQGREKISDAEKLMPQIENQILWCEVSFQKYTSKTYRTRGTQVAEWMKKCYDMPGAEQMEKLGRIKQAKTRQASLPKMISGVSEDVPKNEDWTSKKYYGTTATKIKRFKSALSGGSTKTARKILEDKAFIKSLSSTDYGRLAGRLAFIYYTNNERELAKKFGEIATARKSEYGMWTMGLSAFRDNDYAAAREYFSDMQNLTHINDARRAEGAFWAGRAAELDGDTSAATKYWETAAKRPQLFYGALSAAMLGETPDFQFFDTDVSDDDLDILRESKYGRAALALLQIGDKTRAEKYLRLMITANADNKLLHAVYSVASANELPRVSLQVSDLIRGRGIIEIDQNVIFSAQYPLPDWEPMGGWSIDRALLFAITKQESKFKPSAKSGKGARGVMQMMPGTAKSVARKNNISMSDLDMSDPNHNMFLGQQHIVDLLAMPAIDGNIIKMLAAYNSGDGAVAKFDKGFDTSDPLLYIESFPNIETRNYIKRVVSNLWLYRARLNQPLTSLEDLANGKWPLYSSEDEYVQNAINGRTI
ncbi:MAG: lytic transglycosylase domain-containing protein [Rickettsiales bacterium]|jgi:soluble lytic murein transglycosylase-like protein|nr:lytic transglycosylase domain-containing protein [Rickettsiales bacterium]